MNSELIAIAAPIVSAAVGYLLKRRLDRQDRAIREVHVMVNDRFHKVVVQLTEALADNVRLKDEAGEPPGPPVGGS